MRRLVDNREVTPNWTLRVKRPGEPRNLSRSATRALDVVELFGRMRRPLRAIEIARTLDLHPSTANQLLKTMVGSAHLTFEAGSKTYLPSPRLVPFGFWISSMYGGDERLRRLVQHVRSAGGEIVTLTTPNDLFMQIIDLAGGVAIPQDPEGAERGLRVSMFGSATGTAYLSTLPAPEVRRLATRARIPVREHGKLDELLKQVREAGVAYRVSSDETRWSIAVPLPAKEFTVPFVLGISGPAERVQANSKCLAELLRTSVSGIAGLGREGSEGPLF